MNEPDPSIGTRRFVVGPDGDRKRLDVYLAERFPLFSRSKLQRLIADGNIESPSRALKPSSSIASGEELFITAPGLSPVGPEPPLPPVLFEDDRLLVVDKPAGMLTHPTGLIFSYALVGIARAARPEDHVDLAHRLDRETSGINVLTKDKVANAFLKAAFKAQDTRKVYNAIVHGSPPWDELDVDAPIGHAPGSSIRIRRGIAPDGLPAQTHFSVLKRMDGLTLIRAEPRTGRTHQIRVHLEHAGFPILGDKMYGQPDDVFLHQLDHGPDARVRAATGFPRHALHATELTVPHPGGGSHAFAAPLAMDIAAIVEGATPCWPATEE